MRRKHKGMQKQRAGHHISFKHSSDQLTRTLVKPQHLLQLKRKCPAHFTSCLPHFCMCSPETNFNPQCRLPVWIASLLRAAKRLKSDGARRKKVYRLLHRKLVCPHAAIQTSYLILSLHHASYMDLCLFKTLMTGSHFLSEVSGIWSEGVACVSAHLCLS